MCRSYHGSIRRCEDDRSHASLGGLRAAADTRRSSHWGRGLRRRLEGDSRRERTCGRDIGLLPRSAAGALGGRVHREHASARRVRVPRPTGRGGRRDPRSVWRAKRADTNPRIPAEEVAAPFSSGLTTSTPHGTGLFVTKWRIESLGGEVAFEPRERPETPSAAPTKVTLAAHHSATYQYVVNIHTLKRIARV